VDVYLEETAVGSMEIGQPAELTLRAFPGRSFSGRVSSINGTMVGERQTKDSMNVRSVRVRVQVEQGDRYMRPGMSVEVRMVTGATS
jgi:multidrug resistance efflux pump